MSNIINSVLTPGFLARRSSTVTSVTGDGTLYQIIFDLLVNGNNYNTSTGVFTAAIAGEYVFSSAIIYTNLGVAGSNGLLEIVTTSKTYVISTCNPGVNRSPDNNFMLFGRTIPVLMSAGDTAVVKTSVSGTSKNIGINGSQTYTYFSGRRVF